MPYMPDDAYRAELEAALAVLEPQIRGLHDLLTVSISSQLRDEIQHEITARERRKALIQDMLTAMDNAVAVNQALIADGYPALPPTQLSPPLFSELQGQEDDLTSAVSVFAGPPPASVMTIGLGEPTPKTPQPGE
jgi:hypothetical protein